LTDTVSHGTTEKERLPAGWVWSEIGSVAELIRGVSYKKSDASNSPRPDLVPILRANNIGDGRLNFDELVYVPPQAISDKQYVRALDVVIAMSSGSKKLVGKAGQATRDYEGGFGAFCGLVRSSELLDKRYVGLFFQGEIYREAISELSSGININNLRRQHIEEMPIPLAPLNEQRRIVEKIEELFTKLDAGVRSLEQAQALLKSYRRSVLKAAVEGELSREWREAHKDELEPASELLERILQERREKFEGKKYKEPASPDTSELPVLPDGWEWATVGQLSTKVTDGVHRTPKYVDDGVPFLSVNNMSERGALSFSPCKYITRAEHEELYQRCNPEKDDVLLSKVGTVGLTAVVTTDVEFSLFVNTALIKPIPKQMSSRFLSISIRHGFGAGLYSRHVGGSNQKFIGTTKIGSLPTPLPPIAEQQVIVDELERRLSVVDKLEATVEANLKQADALRQSILKRAFSGELVPQDPDDEPASVLLERIRKEREATKPKASRGRRSKASPANRSHAEQGGLF
jgi:type I restriction enzyme S subunit